MDEIEVDVFICTYNRSSLIDAVNSVLEQKMKNIHCIVHVIDNDEEKSALPLVRVHPQVRYHHAPKRNISIARNKALDVATREYLAFMDDDQVASPDWLANLAQTQQNKNADIVLGPVLARYPDKTADWIKNGDFFSTRPSYKNNHRIETGYTGNVLIRRSTVGNTRFREELGQSGGEDTIFFHELYQKGATFAFSQDALMTEHIDPNRLRISWLMRRNIRNGQTYARILRQSGTRHAIAIMTALAKIAYSFTSSIICMTSPVAWRRNLLRGMFHFGVLTNFFGKTDLQNY